MTLKAATLGSSRFSRRSAAVTLVFPSRAAAESFSVARENLRRDAYTYTQQSQPQQQQQQHRQTMLPGPGHSQPASPFPRQSPSDWKKDNAADVAALFSPANFLEPTTPETFLELDPAGFFSSSSSNSGTTKGSCAAASRRTPPSQFGFNCWSNKLEPSREPCTDEIPWPDLVFWLGNASTGEVVCSCAQCARRATRCSNGNLMRHRYSPYPQQQQQQQQHQQQRRVSSRVPVINLPRIEGVN